jgi:hypothetical protein
VQATRQSTQHGTSAGRSAASPTRACFSAVLPPSRLLAKRPLTRLPLLLLLPSFLRRLLRFFRRLLFPRWPGFLKDGALRPDPPPLRLLPVIFSCAPTVLSAAHACAVCHVSAIQAKLLAYFDEGEGNRALRVTPAVALARLRDSVSPDGAPLFELEELPDTCKIQSFFSTEKTRRRNADTRAVPVPLVVPVRRCQPYTSPARADRSLCPSSQAQEDLSLRARLAQGTSIKSDELARALKARGQRAGGKKAQRRARLEDYFSERAKREGPDFGLPAPAPAAAASLQLALLPLPVPQLVWPPAP